MDLEVFIHRPLLILQDRPYLKKALEVDLGEITISNISKAVVGRIKALP